MPVLIVGATWQFHLGHNLWLAAILQAAWNGGALTAIRAIEQGETQIMTHAPAATGLVPTTPPSRPTLRLVE